MENTQTPENKPIPAESKAPYATLPLKNRKAIFIALGIAAVLIVAALLTMQGYIVAATVNGTPISRFSVIQELEKRSGKQALEARVQDALITSELKKANISVTEVDVNAEIEKIKAQVASQGETFEAALAEQGMTEAVLRKEIEKQKGIEKLIADKVQVTDADIDAYITENKITKPRELAEADFRTQVGEALKRQKLQAEGQQWIQSLVASAKVKYYVNY